MNICFYFDEDSMDRALVRALRGHGVDIITALEARMIEQADEKHLSFAAIQERVLYSSNIGDFCRLHNAWLTQSRSHPGMVLSLQQHFSVGERMRCLLKLVRQLSAEDMKNRVEFLSNWR